METAIGIDIGGSNLRAARLDAKGVMQEHHARPIQGSEPELLLRQCEELVTLCIAKGEQVPPIGLAIPAPVNPFDGSHGQVFNVPALNRMNLSAELRRLFGTRICVDNDANAAALGLVRFGSCKGENDLVYVTVSTSIGAGIIAGGRLIHGLSGGAGEFGHCSIDWEDELCYECGRNHGCITSIASGQGLVWRARRLAELGRLAEDSPLRDPALDGRRIGELADGGDKDAAGLLERAGQALGTATANLVNLLNPGRVAFGGSVIRNQDRIWHVLCDTVEERCMPQLKGQARIERITEGDEVGVCGAAALVWEGER